ncbi:uncharacterized protein [Amphiura filiformis]|uniref:uncharacterized protein n=1 Tax=Amphiura filiformis TaxID=82378 RepID=UPI003B22759D
MNTATIQQTLNAMNGLAAMNSSNPVSTVSAPGPVIQSTNNNQATTVTPPQKGIPPAVKPKPHVNTTNITGANRPTPTGAEANENAAGRKTKVSKTSDDTMANGDDEDHSVGARRLSLQAQSLSELMMEDRYLQRLFYYFSACERCTLAQVCKRWRAMAYNSRYWKYVTPILHKRDLYDDTDDGGKMFTSLSSFEQRGFESVCLVSVSDLDICEFIDHCPKTKKTLRGISLKRSTVTDAGLEVMLEQLGAVTALELSGCNDFTEAGLWSSLQPRVTCLSISDCINVADESVAAIAQRLPNLRELNLQAYHVTDSVLAYFPARPNGPMSILRLKSCWELTNHAVVNIVHCLPQLVVLSLSGCSKITDEAVELIAENMNQLKCLDLSWCPRITDAALEYIACDLPKLEELVLDRCVRITDTGIGFLSTMNCMRALYLRWCCQVQDFGLQHLYNMKSLAILSVAGCPLLTGAGLSGLAQLKSLEELELTNCPGSSPELLQYFVLNLPKCIIVH